MDNYIIRDENTWNNISIVENEDQQYWYIKYNCDPDFSIDAMLENADDGDVVSAILNYNYSYQLHSLYGTLIIEVFFYVNSG